MVVLTSCSAFVTPAAHELKLPLDSAVSCSWRNFQRLMEFLLLQFIDALRQSVVLQCFCFSNSFRCDSASVSCLFHKFRFNSQLGQCATVLKTSGISDTCPVWFVFEVKTIRVFVCLSGRRLHGWSWLSVRLMTFAADEFFLGVKRVAAVGNQTVLFFFATTSKDNAPLRARVLLDGRSTNSWQVWIHGVSAFVMWIFSLTASCIIGVWTASRVVDRIQPLPLLFPSPTLPMKRKSSPRFHRGPDTYVHFMQTAYVKMSNFLNRERGGAKILSEKRSWTFVTMKLLLNMKYIDSFIYKNWSYIKRYNGLIKIDRKQKKNIWRLLPRTSRKIIRVSHMNNEEFAVSRHWDDCKRKKSQTMVHRAALEWIIDRIISIPNPKTNRLIMKAQLSTSWLELLPLFVQSPGYLGHFKEIPGEPERVWFQNQTRHKICVSKFIDLSLTWPTTCKP